MTSRAKGWFEANLVYSAKRFVNLRAFLSSLSGVTLSRICIPDIWYTAPDFGALHLFQSTFFAKGAIGVINLSLYVG